MVEITIFSDFGAQENIVSYCFHCFPIYLPWSDGTRCMMLVFLSAECLMSSASIQKLFCGIDSALKCSFDEFVREKVVSPPYSSAILGPPPDIFLKSVCRRCIIQLIMGSVDSEFAICQYWVNKHSRHSAIVYAVFYPWEAKLNLIANTQNEKMWKELEFVERRRKKIH